MADATAALARCVGDPQRFLAERWGTAAHLHRRSNLAGALSVDDVDHLLTSTALRTPAFRVVRGGATIAPATYTRQARIGSRTVTDLIDVGRVLDLFGAGATIVLQGLQRYWPPVAEICRALERELTHPVQANAYLTPPVAQGLQIHADGHDVFAIQTHGCKQWVIYGEDDDRPVLDTTLEAGDCLYLPKGVRHAARTVDTPSLHLTIGVRIVTWADVLEDLWKRAADDPLLREPLPAGFAHGGSAEDGAALAQEAERRLAHAVDRLGAQDAREGVARAAARFRTRRAAALGGQLVQVLGLDRISETTIVARRPDTCCEVEVEGCVLRAHLPDRTLTMPAHVEPALRRSLATSPFSVGDLAGHLDEPGRLTLVRRLVREGLLVVVDD